MPAQAPCFVAWADGPHPFHRRTRHGRAFSISRRVKNRTWSRSSSPADSYVQFPSSSDRTTLWCRTLGMLAMSRPSGRSHCARRSRRSGSRRCSRMSPQTIASNEPGGNVGSSRSMSPTTTRSRRSRAARAAPHQARSQRPRVLAGFERLAEPPRAAADVQTSADRGTRARISGGACSKYDRVRHGSATDELAGKCPCPPALQPADRKQRRHPDAVGVFAPAPPSRPAAAIRSRIASRGQVKRELVQQLLGRRDTSPGARRPGTAPSWPLSPRSLVTSSEPHASASKTRMLTSLAMLRLKTIREAEYVRAISSK